jgi:hypothetical protein
VLISTVFITVTRLRRKQWCLDTPDLPLGNLLRQRVVTHSKVFMVGIRGCAFGFRCRKTPCHFIPYRNSIRLGWDRWKDAKQEVPPSAKSASPLRTLLLVPSPTAKELARKMSDF